MLIHFYRFIDRLKSTPARKNKAIIFPLIIALILNILIWALIYFKFRPLVMNLPADQSFIPLHYNIYLGIDAYGYWTNLYWLPGWGLIFWIINAILAFTVYNKKIIAGYYLALFQPLIQLLLGTGTILIILMNI